MLRTLALGVIASAIPILSATAAPATPEEAARLQTVFERYVGKPEAGEPSGIAVSPKGDGYVATLDLKRAASGLASLGITVDPYTTVYALTPQGDGTWAVHSQDSPPLVVHLGPDTLSFAAASAVFDGVFDPKLRAFTSFKQTKTGETGARSSARIDQTVKVDSAALSGTGAAADGGATDVTGRYDQKAVNGSVVIKPSPTEPVPDSNPAVPPPSMGPTAVDYAIPSATADFAVTRLRAGSLLDLWAFLVAHPTHDSLVAAQDEFKALLHAGLPFAEGFKETASLPAVTVTTPIGPVTAKSVAVALDASGLSGSGKLAEALSLSDLEIPPGQLPPWSSGLVPTALDLHLGFDGFDAADAAAKAVDSIDLSKDVVITPEQKAAVAHLFWPGTGALTVLPSRLTTRALDLKIEGRIALGAAPAGSVTITGTGLDKEIAALQAQSATDPGAGQILGPLVLAKNLAKPNPDGSLSWVIVFGGGPVTINGAALQ